MYTTLKRLGGEGKQNDRTETYKGCRMGIMSPLFYVHRWKTFGVTVVFKMEKT